MKYRRIKAAAIAALFLIAGVLYSASRSQDIFLFDNSLESGGEKLNGLDNFDPQNESDMDKPAAEETSSDDSDGSAGSASSADNTKSSDVFESGAGNGKNSAEKNQIHVHVCGAVKEAGVYLLSADSIVEDAIKAAGGVSEGGAADYLNLAGTVSEGDKIYVPFLEDLEDPYGVAEQSLPETGTWISGTGDKPTEDSQNTLVNINTADKVQLMTLSGIGETRAEAIISYREANGGFRQIEDVMKVSGIKEGAFEKIKDQITV